jgi:hypothetical protein
LLIVKMLVITGLVLVQTSVVFGATVTYSDLNGVNFSFKSLSETGAQVPLLDVPSLITNPQDSISFTPTSFVVAESNGSIRETSALSSELTFAIHTMGSQKLGQLELNVLGSWSETKTQNPLSEAISELKVSVDLTLGAITKSQSLGIAKNLDSKSWTGSLSFSRAALEELFAPGTMDIMPLQVVIRSEVKAEALYANARSEIDLLTVTAQPIPEPSTSHLILLGAGLCLALMRSANRSFRVVYKSK